MRALSGDKRRLNQPLDDFCEANTAAGYRLAWRNIMSHTQFDSRTADKFVARLPDGLRAEIEAIATSSDRSMNSVFVQAVRQYLDNQHRQELLLEALAASVDKVSVNQIALDGENVNQQQNAPQNIPNIIPANWTDKQVLDFCSVALRHVVVEGDLKFSDINDALRYMADKGEPAFLPAFNIDDHVRMAANAKRYEWLRDNACIEDADNDLMVVRGDRYFNGAELDAEIDNAIRLARLEEQQP